MSFYLIAVILECPSLDVPTNGAIVYASDTTPDFEFGTTATYSCMSGYGLSGGDVVRTCGCNGGCPIVGGWSGTAPTCEGRQHSSMFIYCCPLY